MRKGIQLQSVVRSSWMVRKYNLAVGTSILERQILFGKEKRII